MHWAIPAPWSRSRGESGARLGRFAATAPGGTADLDASPNAITALGDGSYFYAGHRHGDAAAGVVAPTFDAEDRLAPPATTSTVGGSGGGEGGDGGASGTAGGPGEGGPGFGRPAVPGGLPRSVTRVLVAAAAVASLAAIGVTALSWRRL